MTQIEKIIQDHVDPHIFKDINGYNALEDAMKEYADYHLQMYIESIIPSLVENVETYPSREYIQIIDPRKLIKLKLPEHE